MSETNTIRFERDEEGIVVLTMDDPNQSANTMNATFVRSLGEIVDRLEVERDNTTGIVIASAKKTFFAGGELNDLRAVTKDAALAFAAGIRVIKDLLRRLELLGRPVVAAINGAALGGGLEICLACHHRVIVDDPKAKVGFPEVTLGLLPGAGGITRSVRMFGVVDALNQLLLEGQAIQPANAKQMGLVDEIVATRDDLIPAAKAWIQAKPAESAVQPWDREAYEIPGGTPGDPQLAMTLPALTAKLSERLKGANYPAPYAILATAVEGAQVDFDSATEIEGRYFVDLATGQVAKNMIQAFFFDLQQVNGNRGRPDSRESFVPKKVVVLGAGMMGAAIAYVCAAAGIDVVLKDMSLESAERGKDYSRALTNKAVTKGRASKEYAEAVLARITATSSAADAAGADLVIEAVFEDPALKARVFAEIEPHLADGALLGSNTSTLPITGLADGVSRPADFIGLHFFSPVDKMPLLEIIKGEQTTDETLYRALDLARTLKKTPIVVNDSRGFFTSRVIISFLNEGIAMLADGVPAPSIEQASLQAGYPVSVLQLADELNLELLVKIREATKAAIDIEGNEWSEHPAFAVIDKMLANGRAGKLRGAGFYDYEGGVRGGLWNGLRDAFPRVADPSAIPLRDLTERMLFSEALETLTCLDEGVIESVADANIGSILGIGFPGWTGGVVQYIKSYEGGIAGFAARASQLAERYGQRFEPPDSLVEKAKSGETYSDMSNKCRRVGVSSAKIG
jgi:3-hydroxyacyl-CoA dehydrogenase/enoyl-CoA hydratase/3-hydroxybutyryl-CoA epimerase